MDEQKLLRKKNKAQAENNNLLLVSACADLANLYFAEAKYNAAIEEYEIMARIYKSENKLINYAQSIRMIGEAYLGLSMFEKALEYQQIYLDISKSEQDKHELQRAYATVGHTYLSWFLTTQDADTNHLHKAYKMFMKSMIVCESLTNIGKIEKVDMTARLFNNLGVVQECLKNYDKSQELITKSIQICKQHDLYEELNRGYMTMASLYDKLGDYKNVIYYYNHAIKAAKNLRSKPEVICASLIAKAQALIKLGDFHGVKHVLYKAYKLKTPIDEDNQLIEHMLRVVAVLCKTEDQLVVTSDNQSEIKKLYEKMGDCACELKNFNKAIDYYKKTLEAAEKSGASKRELGNCYYSLAETYVDNGQYNEAVEYFEKEYNMVQDRFKDSLNSLCKIIDTKEFAGAGVDEIKALYEKTFEHCRKHKNIREELRMVTRCLIYMRRYNHHTEAYYYEQRVNELENQCNSEDYLSSDGEVEHETAGGTGDIGDDISLDNLTDVSDDSDNDNVGAEGRSSRVKRKRNIIVKNMKGESKLHLAAINGNLLTAQVLIEQGHPVNIRDNAGWLPLHEACNNGHIEIVRLLIEHGSAVNDRGDSQGITPLLDAAYNGHIDIMELLLENGASALAITDDGETPLQALQNWMATNPIDQKNEEKYAAMIKRLTNTMEKAGQQIKINFVRSQVPSAFTLVKDKENIQTSQKPSLIRRNQSHVDDFDFSDSDNRGKDFFEEGASEYRKVMANLKNKNVHSSNVVNHGEAGIKRTALVCAEDSMDDWLEDDMKTAKKKRKMQASTNKISPPSQTRKTLPRRITVDSYHSIDDNSFPDDFFQDNMEIEEASQIVPEDKRHSRTSLASNYNEPSTSKRASQSSLLDSGFSRCKTPTTITTQNKNKTPLSQAKKKQQYQLMLTNPRFSQQVEDVTYDLVSKFSSPKKITSPIKSMSIADPTLFVDVRIEGRLYRVPVLLSQVQSHTIKWLGEQAANRYASKEYMKPTLELETKNGAVLADEDLLSLLFPMGAMQAEQVEARVLKWSLPPLIDRYRESCTHMNLDLDPQLTKLTEEMSDVLMLADKGIKGTAIAPLTKAINHQTNLLEIDISGNFLNTDCIKFLCASLASLENLRVLNLSCTGLQTSHLGLITNAITSNGALKKLSCLNLSDNWLRKESLLHLKSILQQLKLSNLNLSGIGLESDCDIVQLDLSGIQVLDISDNDIHTEDLKCLLATLEAKGVKSLNLSRLRQSNSDVIHTLMEKILNLELMPQLESIELSRANIEDTYLFNLLWHHNRHLTSLNLSYNKDLTGLSLRRLLEHPSLANINLIGCTNICKNFDSDIVIESENLKPIALKMYVDNETSAECIVNIFNNLYGNFRVIVEQLPNFLSIKVNNR